MAGTDGDTTVHEGDAGTTAAASSKATADGPHSLDILHIVKSSQMKNGLRHGDYLRYRQYCTRRLRRIRKNNLIRFMYADKKGRDYEFKSVRAEDVSDERLLLVPLIMAERAWSYAMQLKQDNENDEYPRKYFHMKRRLTKAAKWSTELKELCAATCDARTSLEAEAYEAVMHANLTVQNEDWANAAAKFMHAREIYDQLSQVGSTEERELFRDRIAEDIDPPLAFCKYNNEVEHGTQSSADMLLKLRLQTKGSDLLQSKLDAALAETRKRQSTSTSSTVTWAGTEATLRSERVREAILKVNDTVYELNQLKEENTPQKETLFLDVFNAYDEASRVVRDEINKAQKKGMQKAEALSKELNLTAAYVRFHKFQMVYRRNVLLADDLAAKLSTAAGEVRASDLLRTYSMLVKTTEAMSTVPGVERDDSVKSGVDALGLGCQACCSFYAGEVYVQRGRFVEAAALMEKAAKTASQAMDLHRERASKFSDINTQQSVTKELEKLQALKSQIELRQAVVRAKAALFAKGAEDCTGGGTADDDAAAAGRKGKKTLLERVGEFDQGNEADGHTIAHFPPQLKAIACKPIFFDTAWKCLDFPDLSEDSVMPSKKKKDTNRSSVWGYLGYS